MSEWRDLPLVTQSFEAVDDVQVNQFNALAMDIMTVEVEGKRHIVKRPGQDELVDLGTNAPVDGLFWYNRGHVALAVSAGRVFKISDQLGTTVELIGSTALQSNNPVRFAGTTASSVVMANGGQMVYTDLFSLTTMADTQAPVNVTHVASLDQYILANVAGSGTVQFSDINNPTSWQSLSFFSAESSPDDIVAIGEGFREIIALGSETVEFWINDGQNPFSRIQGSAQPFGTEAPYSLALVGNTWMWLDHTRRFATMQGRQVVNVSTPFDRVIQRYQSVDNAIGYALSIDGVPLYAINFPTDGQTLIYNYMTQEWYRWGYWVSTSGTYERHRGNAYCYARDWNYHLLGDHSNGKIYRASRTIYTDTGNPIRSLLRTGHISHGTHADKISDIVRLHCKRAVANTDVPNPQIMMRRRLNNRQEWQHERWMSLGQAGQHIPFLDWRRNGEYKTCQYEFVHSDATDLVVMGAQEYVELLSM